MRRGRVCFVVAAPMTITAFLRQHVERISDDYDVFVIANFSEVSFADSERVKYIHVPMRRKISPWHDLFALFELCSVFRKYRFDVVHSVTPKAGLLSMLAARLSSVPNRLHWFTGQVWATKAGAARWVLKSADRVIAACASHLLADSPSQKDFLVSEGVCPAQRVEVIGDGSICGVDGERFRPNAQARLSVREAHGIPNNKPVVLFLGRLNADKGLREMAEAMMLVDQAHPEVHWLVVGPDEEGMVDHLRSVAGQLGERLHFQGFTSEPEAYMAAADIFCLPSYREGFGSSVLEAAAAGIPSVASRIYGLTDAVEDGVTGLLVPPGDAKALADSLKCLLEDAELCRSMGNAARERALSKFSRARIVEGLRSFYLRLQPSERGEK